MMQNPKTAFRPLLLSAMALLLSACATLQEVVKEPKVSVQDVRVKAVSLSDMQLDFDLGVENPNPVGISLKGFTYQLDVEEQSLLSGERKQRIKVGANKQSTVTLPLKLVYQEMAGGLKTLVERDAIHYSLNGKLDFGLFRLPYSKSGRLKLPSLPDIRIERVELDRLSLSGINILLSLMIENDNDFPLLLDGIDYGLKLDDTTVARGKSLGSLVLEPGQSDRLDIGLSLGYGELGNMIEMLRNQSSIPVSFDGQMRLPEGGSLPLDWQGDVNIAR